MNNFENLNGAHQMLSSNSSGNGPRASGDPSSASSGGGPKITGQIPAGYQYINKQVNNMTEMKIQSCQNVKLVNNNSLTLNVRNFNNRINNININNIQDEAHKNMTLNVSSHLASQKVQPNMIKTQRYSRENSLQKLAQAQEQ